MNDLQSTTSSPFDGVREIPLSQLEGFTEDKASARAFTLRYFPLTLPPLLAFVAFLILGIRHSIGGWHFFIYAVSAWVVGVAATLWAARRTPVSKISGRPMIRLRRTDAPPGVTEMIYVDTESRTYFRRVTMITGRGAVVGI